MRALFDGTDLIDGTGATPEKLNMVKQSAESIKLNLENQILEGVYGTMSVLAQTVLTFYKFFSEIQFSNTIIIILFS